ncbi:hypothetical protein ILUMI_13500 [Ignelater luminosus]|uniref:DDE Tnp4 domain-containing protein n=1 Tax=Ignelater luminosus TaxID=2038154 RepID=A0A8K0CS75_IGNLU|nr:hypothetical protein ILUMI_13500 [Ignelater luminosus]
MSDNDSNIINKVSPSSSKSSESSSDDDLDFLYERERINRHSVETLAGQFENSEYYKHHSGQYGKLNAFQHILIFLWFVGHQTASFRDVADRFSITISSLFRVIRRVTRFVSNLLPQIIVWPSLLEKNEIEQHFRQTGFPGVVGAIDESHIKIDKPSNDPEDWGHLTRPQRNYNLKLAQNRYIIEHCFELLKQKFRQLYHVKLRSITDTVHLIRTCCVLRNLALQDEFHLQDPGEGNVELPLQLEVIENDEDERGDRTGQQRRNEVVQMLPY